MIDLDTTVGERDEPEQPELIPIFLGLFLLVLAFFILLVSISTFEKVKSNAVMDSLTSTFTTVLPPTSDPNEFNAKDGDIIAGEAFQEEITRLFSTAIQVERIEVVQPGRLMRLEMPPEALFKAGEPAVRDDQTRLLDGIVAALSNRPPGLRQDMEVVFGADVTDGLALPVAETLEMKRAGELGRALTGRGAPPDSIAVGLKPDADRAVHIWFWVHGVEETAEEFQKALEHARDAHVPPAGDEP